MADRVDCAAREGRAGQTAKVLDSTVAKNVLNSPSKLEPTDQDSKLVDRDENIVIAATN
jgi:hypothetical protein